MSICKGVCWQCETCKTIDNIKPWRCPICNIEVCEHCFDKFMLCEKCAEGKTDQECKEILLVFGYDFDEENKVVVRNPKPPLRESYYA